MSFREFLQTERQNRGGLSLARRAGTWLSSVTVMRLGGRGGLAWWGLTGRREVVATSVESRAGGGTYLTQANTSPRLVPGTSHCSQNTTKYSKKITGYWFYWAVKVKNYISVCQLFCTNSEASQLLWPARCLPCPSPPSPGPGSTRTPSPSSRPPSPAASSLTALRRAIFPPRWCSPACPPLSWDNTPVTPPTSWAGLQHPSLSASLLSPGAVAPPLWWGQSFSPGCWLSQY